MIGDVLKNNLDKLKKTSTNKYAKDAFWVVLKEIAVEEIKAYPSSIGSDEIIPIYYEILCDNLEYVPIYFQETLPSNKQERFRVIRNLFSSNAFHSDGLANHKDIIAYKDCNYNKKGERIIYKAK